MERMWRRMNQGLTKPCKIKVQKPDPVPTNATENNFDFAQPQSAKTLLEKRRKRCRKSKPRARSKSASKTQKKVEFPIPFGSKDASSLKERAVAKLKMLNFNLNWSSHAVCRPCRSNINGNIITRRLCRNKQMDDNELYRSNSFKFEKFKRVEVQSNCNTLPRPVSVCDDYSLPFDFVYNRQLSTVSSKNKFLSREQAELNASNFLIKHSKPSIDNVKDYINLRKYASDSSLPKSSDEDLYQNSERDSADSKTDDLSSVFKLNPSPYYYGDIFAEAKSAKSSFISYGSANAVRYKQNTSNYLPQRKKTTTQRRYSVTEDGVHIIKCDSPSTTTSDDSNCTECQKRREVKQLQIGAPNSIQSELLSMPPHRLLEPVLCACTGPEYCNDFTDILQSRSVFYVHEPNVEKCEDCSRNETGLTYDDTMSNGRIRQVYETAFDCKIARSDDDLDELNTVLSKSLNLKNKFKKSKSTDSEELNEILNADISQANGTSDNETKNPSNLPKDFENLQAENEFANQNNDAILSSTLLPSRFKQSPPATAPLPLKFPKKYDTEDCLNSNKSAPNIPQSHTMHNYSSDDVKHDEPKEILVDRILSKQRLPINKTKRPCSMILESERVLALKHSRIPFRFHHKPKNFSSTESITTSSSGGSLESLKSSTSEGNRSTTSSESRHSSTLSSHSSDSGAKIRYPPRPNIMLHSKLHILSPISDKSIQDPTFDNVDSNLVVENISKNSPQSGREFDNFKSRKFPQNRALTALAGKSKGDEIQGSDSGISLQSRDGSKSKQSFHSFDGPKLFSNKLAINKSDLLFEEFGNLPFDMPKLRRKKMLMEQNQCASGSATSVDLGDLPFDMPKLKRKLRLNNQNHLNVMNVTVSTESSELSLSTQSVRGEKKTTGLFKRNLTLKFHPNLSTNQGAGNEKGLHLNFETAANSYPVINVDIPLNRQSWYHGSITRIEAEKILRSLSEGSFLVRNCESSRNDYSLSLKSAKGFMHMRIQMNNSGQFILGHFSQPFESISIMIRHFCLNRLPVRGAEHMCLLEPVAAQLL